MSFNSSQQEEALAYAVAGPDEARQAEALGQLKHRCFLAAMDFVDTLLDRLVAQFTDELTSEAVVRQAPRISDGGILVLPESGLLWTKTVCNEMPDVLFVVYPDSSDSQYQVRTVPVEAQSFKSREKFPAGWAGLRDKGLAAVTGVDDAVFCHNGCFIAGAVSKEGAVKLAERALWMLTPAPEL